MQSIQNRTPPIDMEDTDDEDADDDKTELKLYM